LVDQSTMVYFVLRPDKVSIDDRPTGLRNDGCTSYAIIAFG
jgi:hypothetical protein